MTQASRTAVQTILRGFLKPFDVSTPMGRSHYWLFYLAWMGVLHIISLIAMVLAPAVHSAFGNYPTSILNICLAILVFLAFTSLITATARRMKDAGYKRRYLACAIAGAAGFLLSFMTDVVKSFSVVRTQDVVPPVAWSQGTFVLVLLTLPFLFIVFRGTIKPTKSEKAH